MPDIAILRSDLGAFADAASVPMAPWQVRSLQLETRFTAIVGPRQSGKSRSLATLALWVAFRSQRHRVLIVSAGEEASRRLLAEVRRVATASPLLAGSVVDEQAGLLTLSNGSEIRSVPASERQIRGWTVDLLLCDEAGLIPDDLLLGAAIPTTAARPDARIVLAGSAVTAAGAFYDHVTRGDGGAEHVRSHRWALTDCEWISPTVIQAARESMTETRFAAEYEGVFASGADALFTRQALDRVTADYYIPPLSELRGPARMLAGVDWGATVDRSAFVAIARVPEGGEGRFGVSCAHRWPAGAPLTGPDGVVAEIVRSPAHFARITAERNGLGAPLVEELFRRLQERSPDMGGGQRRRPVVISPHDLDDWLRKQTEQRRVDAWGRKGPWRTAKVALHATPETKAATYSALRMLVEREALLIPEMAVELRRELLMLRVDLSPTGAERIEAGSGHDDLADALAMALGPYRRKNKSWRTVLADVADPARASRLLPAAGVDGGGAYDDELARLGHKPAAPPRNLDVVQTGGGIEIPRHPLFQSIAGAEVSGLPNPKRSRRAIRRGRFTIERSQS